ncbi:hypothetical protein GOP47_0013853 [Adiantum capillus-veneris]|uniref:GH18 domain-containing protein n=1 Tax=Adiantum capillus-veneris TaxID=13818 RepID=A0A9D4ZEY6_ADICA|nr:hypothetical protein GOP47_0013853 [Adiantum capillus-veneris]
MTRCVGGWMVFQWLVASWVLSSSGAIGENEAGGGRMARRALATSAAEPAPAPASGRTSAQTVFMEYIGGGGAALLDVPIAPSTGSAFDFFFILAFATDASTTDGLFEATWQPRLSPSAIATIKAAHPSINFSASIGGGNPNSIFQPTSLDTWIENAVSSLSLIISAYHIDAIDIDYESFGSSSPQDFATCIGELITHLKQKGLIRVATIAPYPGTDDFYSKLWESYKHTIDYVNYQFYSLGDMVVSEYLNVYKTAKSMYKGGVVMASFETLNNGTSIVPSTGLDACKKLAAEGELHGIFIWSADQSYRNFQFERSAQSLLGTLA